ncbi:MAG: hypothetical protein AAGB48_03065 [Planctomycetota bacterium]
MGLGLFYGTLLGSVTLAAAGGVLVWLGWAGRRRIVSRTRRCPRCRYDMTGRPGEMTCPECGLIALDEAAWYGGRLRVRWLVAGALVLLLAAGVGGWPFARERGLISLLPLRAQVEIWPTWLRAWRALDLDTTQEWNAISGLGRRIAGYDQLTGTYHADRELALAAFERCMHELRTQPVTSQSAEDAAYIVGMVPIQYYFYNRELLVPTEDVDTLLGTPFEWSLRLGIELASQADHDPEVMIQHLLAIANASPSDRNAIITSVCEIDRQRGRVTMDAILADEHHPDLQRVAWNIATLARNAFYVRDTVAGEEDELAYLHDWLAKGSPGTRAALAVQLGYQVYNMPLEWDAVSGRLVPTGRGQYPVDTRAPVVAMELIEMIDDESPIIADAMADMFVKLVERSSVARMQPWIAPACIALLDRSVNDATAARILRVAVRNALPDAGMIEVLERFVADDTRPQELRDRARWVAEQYQAVLGAAP